ncbi:MAG: YicC family protein [Acidobacteria bacterium]|nr:YicC family protein [Acidobacteriota bacterium]MCZ6649506.1 YicC family protein [Acidobacteriota bacterium]
MILGMTGFGRGQREKEGLSVAVEVRTVNHRFAEIQMRMPRSLAALEPDLRRQVSARIGRGRAEVSVHLEHASGDPCQVQINTALVSGLQDAAVRLRDKLGISGELDVATALRFPDAVTIRSTGVEADDEVRALVSETLDEALAAVHAMRRQEGEMILSDLLPRLDRIVELHGAIEERAAQIPSDARRRMEQRLAELLSEGMELDPGRLEQEVALLADRTDTTEELVRLAGYLQQTRDLLTTAGEDTNGRRCDFLLQEMNREVNTIGSKSGEVRIGTLVVEIKQELERIREQVQNIA